MSPRSRANGVRNAIAGAADIRLPGGIVCHGPNFLAFSQPEDGRMPNSVDNGVPATEGEVLRQAGTVYAQGAAAYIGNVAESTQQAEAKAKAMVIESVPPAERPVVMALIQKEPATLHITGTTVPGTKNRSDGGVLITSTKPELVFAHIDKATVPGTNYRPVIFPMANLSRLNKVALGLRRPASLEEVPGPVVLGMVCHRLQAEWAPADRELVQTSWLGYSKDFNLQMIGGEVARTPAPGSTIFVDVMDEQTVEDLRGRGPFTLDMSDFSVNGVRLGNEEFAFISGGHALEATKWGVVIGIDATYLKSAIGMPAPLAQAFKSRENRHLMGSLLMDSGFRANAVTSMANAAGSPLTKPALRCSLQLTIRAPGAPKPTYLPKIYVCAESEEQQQQWLAKRQFRIFHGACMVPAKVEEARGVPGPVRKALGAEEGELD